MSIKIKKFYEDAIIPTRGTAQSAGLDLYARIPEGQIVLKKGEVTFVYTGIGVGFPSKDCVGLVYPRSGLASKHAIALINGVGVVDSDYTGELMMPMINHGKEDFIIYHGDRVAQMVISLVSLETPVEVDDLGVTERGTKGFGSTGIK